jgi:undecaprenyl-diphosphatase
VSGLLQFNYMLFQDINVYAGQSSWFDSLMVFCANYLIFCLPLFLLLVWGIPFAWRKRPVQQSEAEIAYARRSAVIWVIVACILAYTLNLAWEQVIFEPRPFISHKVHLLVSHAADGSFPSDHTAWAFAVFGMLAFCVLPVLFAVRTQSRQNPKWSASRPILLIPLLLILLALVIACSIGFARVFVGVHYPGDILGGAVDGLLAAGIVTALSRWLRQVTRVVLGFAHALHLA